MKYFSLLLLFFMLFSCDNSSETEGDEEKPKDNFTVSGKIEGAENSNIYVEALSQKGSIEVAKATIGNDGKFKMTGNIPGMGIYQLRLGEAKDKIIPMTLVENDHVKVNTTFQQFEVKPNVSGTKWSKVMNEYMVLFSVFMTAQLELEKIKGNLSESEIMTKYLEMRKPLDDFSRQKMLEDPSNPFNIVLSTSATPNMGFKDWDPKNLDVLKAVAQAYRDAYEDSPMTLTMENQVAQIESAYNEYLVAGEGMKVAPEIELKTPDGKTLKLSSLRGKIVLIDFWASWCGPCRKENPNVVRLYNKYKDKGFTIYSVSLDDDAGKWKEAISKDGLIWPNHVSDLLGWNSPYVKLYGIQGIPHTVLIDKEGNVIGTGLRGESLEQKLKEVISK